MNQRDTAAQPWADLDPGSGNVVAFPQRARTPAVPTHPGKPGGVRAAADRYQDSIHALRTACAELSEMLEGLSASARSLERSCRGFDEQLQAISSYGGSIANSGDALTAAIRRFRKRLVAAVLADD